MMSGNVIHNIDWQIMGKQEDLKGKMQHTVKIILVFGGYVWVAYFDVGSDTV